VSIKVFLDTCVLNRLVDFGGYFFDGGLAGDSLADYLRRPEEDKIDIDTLRNIMQVYQGASLPLVVSETALAEVMQSPNWRHSDYASELVMYWIGLSGDADFRLMSTSRFKKKVLGLAATFSFIKGQNDRILVAEAEVLKCDFFLTVDRKTLWNRRADSPTRCKIVRPHELWKEMDIAGGL
jgi:predicted nucleic acid-binding protein